MFGRTFARLLPARPRLVLIVGIVLAVVFGVGFVDLALTRQNMLARHRDASAQVEQLEAQNRLLQQDLDRAQKGQHLPLRAWQYFGKTPAGMGVIVAEGDAASAEGDTASAETVATGPAVTPEPAWRAWLKRLTQSLTR